MTATGTEVPSAPPSRYFLSEGAKQSSTFLLALGRVKSGSYKPGQIHERSRSAEMKAVLLEFSAVTVAHLLRESRIYHI